MAESIPRYTSTAEGFRTAKELAALRPVKANAAKPRKPSGKPAMVATGIVCFCGERFSEAQSLEFMKHLRAEVGADLAILNRQRAVNREYMRQRRRQDPEWNEKRREYNRKYQKDPVVRERRRERERERRKDPVVRERRLEVERRSHARNPRILTPEQRERVNQRQRELRTPEKREAQNAAKRARYANDPEYRQLRREQQRERHARKKAEREAAANGDHGE